MTRADLTGDGQSDLLVTSPWGLGVVGWNGGGLVAAAMCQNGRRIGEWALDTGVNRVQLVGDVDGDGRAEALLTSPWGVGVAAFGGGAPSTKAMAANGTRVGGWIIDTTSNRFLHAADVDGDGKAELVVTSPWGIGILGMRPALTSVMLSPNGTRFGDWLLNTADNWFPVVGDLDGDGRMEIVVTSPWGLGVLRFDGGTLHSIAMASNGTTFGSWRLDTAVDRIEAAADFDGDGRAELLVTGPGGVVILGLSGATFEVKASVANGGSAGAWTVDIDNDGFPAVGDLDGDGRAEIVITSDWGLGVLELAGGALQSQLIAANGTRFGGWNLNTRDNRIGPAIDIDGDGHDEVLVTSPWGLGLLQLGGAVGVALTMSANGTRLGDWNLNTADNEWRGGRSRSWCVVLHHPQWGGAVAQTEQVLGARQYVILDTNDAATGIELLARLARAARPGDRVFVYLAGHGGTDRTTSDYTDSDAKPHVIQFESGELWLSDLLPSFELLAHRGIDLAVFDGSCDAGETVAAAAGQPYLAMSTTSMMAPGITDTPSPGDVIQQFGQPAHFGMWWTRTDAASRLTGEAPHRFYQKIYRNDATDIARWSLFYKTAINFYPAVAGSWDLVTRKCYLFEHVYADVMADPNAGQEVADYKATANKVSLQDYLASMQADYDGFTPAVARLRDILADNALVQRAADIYAPAYPRPWQTTTGEWTWDVAAEPTKSIDAGTVTLTPGPWAGHNGFVALVAECLRRITELEASWRTQTRRLTELDNKVGRGRLFTKITDINTLRIQATVTQQLQRSQFDQRVEQRLSTLLTALRDPQVEWPLKPRPKNMLGGLADAAVQIEGKVGEPDVHRPGVEEELNAHPQMAQPMGRVPGGDVHIDPNLEAPHLEVPPPAPHLEVPPKELLHLLDTDRLHVTQLSHAIASRLGDILTPLIPDRSAAEIIADIRATETALWVSMGQLHYYLTIVEEAVSRAQESAAQPGDLITI